MKCTVIKVFLVGFTLGICQSVAAQEALQPTKKMACIKKFNDLALELEKTGKPAKIQKAKKLKIKTLDSKGDKLSFENDLGEAEIFTEKTKFKIKSVPRDLCQEESAGSENSKTKLMAIYEDAIKIESDDTAPIKSLKERLVSDCPDDIKRHRTQKPTREDEAGTR